MFKQATLKLDCLNVFYQTVSNTTVWNMFDLFFQPSVVFYKWLSHFKIINKRKLSRCITIATCTVFIRLYKPSDFCNKLNWEQVKSHQDGGLSLKPSIFINKSYRCLQDSKFHVNSTISQAIINTNFRSQMVRAWQSFLFQF